MILTMIHGLPMLFTTRDSQFTVAIVSDLIKIVENLIFRFKSDNCAQQYKSRSFSANWKDLAQENNKTLIVHYGISGHGKDLVDSMSSFGVQAPIWKSIVTEMFFSMMLNKLRFTWSRNMLTKLIGFIKLFPLTNLKD